MVDPNRYYTVKGKGKNKKVVRKEIPTDEQSIIQDKTKPEPLTEEKISDVMKHPALALYEWPEVPEISKQENPVAAWLAEATAYIALHLQAHNCFRIEISNENLKSLKLIYPTFIGIQNHLPSVLPNYESRYNQVYKPFQETLQNFDAIADTPAKRAGIFLERVKDFLNLILTIHSETLRKYGKAEQTPASGKSRNTPVTLREFMREYCEELTKSLLESRIKSLQSLHQRRMIKLQHVGKYKRGQSKKYLPSFLISKWPTYRKVLQSLPELKQS